MSPLVKTSFLPFGLLSNIGIELIQETFSNLDTRDVFKCKAQINALRGKQTHGVNYWETYSPVVK